VRSTKVPGPFRIAEDLRLYGVIAGDAHVASGAVLELYGVVAGDLILDANGQATIFDVVAGGVANRGRVDVRGVIVRAFTHLNGGTSSIAPEAVVDVHHV
jgi:hypothetical protein